MLVQHIQTACNAFKLAESFPLDLCKWRNLTSIQTVSTFVGYKQSTTNTLFGTAVDAVRFLIDGSAWKAQFEDC